MAKKPQYQNQYRMPFGEITKRKNIEDPREASVEYFSPEIQKPGAPERSSYTESGYNLSEDYPLVNAFPRRWFDYDVYSAIECSFTRRAFKEFNITGGVWDVVEKNGKKFLRILDKPLRLVKKAVYYVLQGNEGIPVTIEQQNGNRCKVKNILTDDIYVVSAADLLTFEDYIKVKRIF